MTDLRQEWETPPDLFEALDREFAFDIDVCALRDNAKCGSYIEPSNDGLSGGWFSRYDDFCSAWCNPGFSNVLPWIERANEEIDKEFPGRVAVVLAVSTHSSKWYDYALHNAVEIRHLSPRPQFIPPPGIKKSSNANETCAIIFRKLPVNWTKHGHRAREWTWNWKDVSCD